MKRIILVLYVFLSCIAPLSAFEAGAYIPHYRLKSAAGASNFLGRPLYDTAAQAWDQAIRADQLTMRPPAMPGFWYEYSWSLRLGWGFDAFYLHIPMNDDFLLGKMPITRYLDYLKRIVGKSEKSIYLSLIGTSRDFLPRISTASDLEDFTDYIGELVKTHELRGIELDWEFPALPSRSEKREFTRLMAALRGELSSSVSLSVAVSRWRLPDPAVFAIVDEVHLMAYDNSGRHSTYQSALEDSEALLAQIDLLPSKLLLGLPFYGRVFDSDSPDYWRDTKNYRNIRRDFHISEDYVDVAGPYHFNGPTTITRKTQWAQRRGLKGVFVWEPYYDATGSASLIRAVRRGVADSDYEGL